MIRISLRSLAVLAVVLLLSGCNKSTKVISEWDAGRDDINKRERIAVIAMMPEALQRLTAAQEIVSDTASLVARQVVSNMKSTGTL